MFVSIVGVVWCVLFVFVVVCCVLFVFLVLVFFVSSFVVVCGALLCVACCW